MLKKIETVLIGTSLTEASDEVVRSGLKVARAAKARVVLVHAYSPRAAYGGAPFVPEVALDEVFETERKGLRRDMDSQAERLGVRIEELAATILGPGPAHQMLIETADKFKAGLIVVGASEVPRMAKLFGSTADRVVRRAVCPVLVVRQGLTIPPARVLLPVDLSILSAEAFHEGLDVLALLAGERGDGINLEALYVVTELDRRLFAPEEAPERAEQHAKEELRTFVDRHAAGSPFKIVPRITAGYVEEEILARLHEWEPDLVVLGTHGRSGFERFLLGSVATRVIRDGGTNLLIVPPSAARQQAEAVREANQEVLVG
ncbi:MAG TPA: universal stress protein [Thermoanaerobaculia bacterium]|nr:universal stress protein [Thermoanaerobaculia bacterium]